MKTNRVAWFSAMVLLSLTAQAQPIQPEVLASFPIAGAFGTYPSSALTLGNDGNFYGTTSQGGSDRAGTVFQVTPDGTLTLLVSFNGTNGAYPSAGLILGNDGNFYGTAGQGGSVGPGTVFQVTPDGALTTLVSFDGLNGSSPAGALALGSDGGLYGTTSAGGSNGGGTVFRVTTNGTLTTLASFFGTNGANPQAALTLGSDGDFYGTTSGGGSSGVGTVFKVTTNGTLTTLVSFDGANGANPFGSLTLGPDGNFYGTTYHGGSSDRGTVFQMTTNSTLTTLVLFNDTNGANPGSAMTLGSDGNFYGTTSGGGSSGVGTVFKVTTNGTLTTLVSFAGANGASPFGSLTLGLDGNFYGTTYYGGSNGLGTIFRLGGSPVILTQPQPASQIVPAGINVTINASAFGTFPLNYQWLFNGTNLPGASGASLTLNNVNPSMSGVYALRVTNSLSGPVLSSNALLTVLPSLVTTLPASGITSTSVVLRGAVTFGTTGTLAWFEWGPDTNYGQIHSATNLPGGNGTVTLSNVLSGLDGNLIYHYRMVDSNSFGTVYGSDVSFQVGVNPTAVTLGAAGTTTTNLTLNATVNPGGRQTTAWFQWGVSTNYGSLTPATIVGSGATSLSFSNLLAEFSLGATYHCRVVASNSLSLATGGDATFLVGAPLVVTEPATSVTGTNAAINGLVTPNLLTTTAWFEWGTNTNYGNIGPLGNVGSGSAAVGMSNFLSNLDAAVTYHFRLVASNSAGVGFGTDALISVPLDAYAQSVLADQPMLYYRFGEASGTTVMNYGTNGSAGNGTYNSTVSLGNPSLMPAFGFAAGFNNSNSLIAVPALGSYNQATLEVWARPRSFAVANASSPNHSSYNSIYTADNYVSGALHTHFLGGSPAQLWALAISPSDFDIQTGNAGYFPSNTWVHLVATHDSPAHRTIAYVNGRAIATNNSSTTVPVNLAAAHLGNWVGHANWFDGQLDEFAIYSSVLPASRIQAHYQAAIGNPVLNSQRITNKLTFSWAGPGFRLQSNTNLASAAGWTNVPAGSNSPVSITLSNSGNRFFRLQWP